MYKEKKSKAKKAVAMAKGRAYEDLYARLKPKEDEKKLYRCTGIVQFSSSAVLQQPIRIRPLRRLEDSLIETFTHFASQHIMWSQGMDLLAAFFMTLQKSR